MRDDIGADFLGLGEIFIGFFMMFIVVEITGLAVDEEEEFVFEFMGGAGVDSWEVETDFFYVEVGDFEFVADCPFLVELGE